MNVLNDRFETHVRNLRIIFWALFISQFMLAAIAINIITINDQAIAGALFNVLIIICSLLLIICVPSGILIYKRKIAKIAEIESEEERMEYHRSSNILMYALFEAPSLLGIISMTLTSNYLFLLIAGLSLVAFLTNIPGEMRFRNELGLTD